MVRLTVNKLGVTQYFNRAGERDFEKEFPVGDTVRAKYPQRYNIREGFDYVGQNIDRKYTTITADQKFGVDLNWDTIEKALEMERTQADIEDNLLDPAASQVAQEIDSRACRHVYLNTPNVVGALGTNPTALLTFSQARSRIKEMGGWEGARRRITVITPAMMDAIIASSNNVLALFNPDAVVGRAFKEGVIGRYAETDWYTSMSLYRHTTGVITTQATGTTMSGASQSGNSLTLAGTSTDTLKAGDIVTIANVNAVNAMTRRSIGGLRGFKILADAVFAASAATVSVYPSIVGPGSPYQNVDALNAAAAIVLLMPGTSMVDQTAKTGVFGFTMTSDAFGLVNIDLPMPKEGEGARGSKYTDPETGITIGLMSAIDFDRRSWKNRWDCWLGFGNFLADSCSVLIGGSN